ncbi:MAG: sulfite exporter TauE/SafE family protein [Solirubrobacteraceae bacterium]
MIALVAVGVIAGLLAGLLGVGGGVLFVPALVIFAGLSQHVAEGTSLLAIVPVVLVGAANQRRYRNVNGRDGVALGLLSVGGAAVGVVLSDALPGSALRYAFAALTLYIAFHLAWDALRRHPDHDGAQRLDDVGSDRPGEDAAEKP